MVDTSSLIMAQRRPKAPEIPDGITATSTFRVDGKEKVLELIPGW